jgi:hypothetical protein
VTLFVALPLREPASPPRPAGEGSALAQAGREIKAFVVDAARAFVGTRAALVGVLFAILPGGAGSTPSRPTRRTGPRCR